MMKSIPVTDPAAKEASKAWNVEVTDCEVAEDTATCMYKNIAGEDREIGLIKDGGTWKVSSYSKE